MAVMSSSASSVVSAGTWLTTTNVYTSNDSYATNVGTTQNTEYPMDVGGFNFAALTALDTINTVTVTIEAKTGTNNRAQIKGELYDGTTKLTGERALTNLTNTDANYTFTVAATRAQLQSANLKVRVTNKRIVSQASTTSVDFVKIDVDYSPPPPSITQAAYRFFADGTEWGSSALAPQDSGFTADLSSGNDLSLQLRILLQSTTIYAVDATDDFALQWEKNSNGTWSNVFVDFPVDSYNPATGLQALAMIVTSGQSFGQQFSGNNMKLGRGAFWLKRIGTPATTSLTAHLYASSTALGTLGVPTGSVLTSSLPVSVSSLPLHPALLERIDFTFDGTFTLAQGTPYFMVVSTNTPGADVSNCVAIQSQITGFVHAGVAATNNAGSWIALNDRDMSFEVGAADLSSPINAFNSANLAAGGPIISRLTNGTGSYTQGKISEDGVINDQGWSGNNYTEFLYSLILRQANLVNGDTLRFRVLRNNSTAVMTYTMQPTLQVAKGEPPPGGKPKVWNGSAWVEKPVKVWNGSGWVEKPMKYWTGSTWELV